MAHVKFEMPTDSHAEVKIKQTVWSTGERSGMKIKT